MELVLLPLAAVVVALLLNVAVRPSQQDFSSPAARQKLRRSQQRSLVGYYVFTSVMTVVTVIVVATGAVAAAILSAVCIAVGVSMIVQFRRVLGESE